MGNLKMRYIFTVGQTLLLASLTLFEGGKGQEVGKPIDFADLKLDIKALLGSRWAIEHPNATTVYHAIQIVDMVKVDVADMCIRVDFHMQQRWEAIGLELPEGLFEDGDPEGIFIPADENVLDSVWSPDSYVPNARVAQILSLTTTMNAVNIYKNKTILYKARMYALLACSFTFQWYPLDVQVCDLSLEDYKYTERGVSYEWEPINPVTVLPGILLYQYDVELPPRTITNGTTERWSGRFKYPYVKITFKFERKLGNNIIQLFIPTILVVILSFFSFWLGLDAIPGRISLLITCILTLVTMHSGSKGVIPPVQYVKMSDIWMIGCMCFVFGAILEFVIIKYLKWSAEQRQALLEEQEKLLKKHGLMHNNIPPAEPQRVPNVMNKMYNMPNVVYPSDYGMHQKFMQNNNNSQNHLRNSTQDTTAQNRIGVHPGFNMQHPSVGGDYNNGFINMHGMPMYDHRQFFPPIPPPSRPIWVKIDRACRVAFPLFFVVFNAVYWPMLLNGSANQYKDV